MLNSISRPSNVTMCCRRRGPSVTRSHLETGHSDRGPRAWGPESVRVALNSSSRPTKCTRYAFMPPFDRACPARVAKLAGRSFTIAPLEPISGGATSSRTLLYSRNFLVLIVSRLSCFRNEVNSVLIRVPTCSLAVTSLRANHRPTPKPNGKSTPQRLSACSKIATPPGADACSASECPGKCVRHTGQVIPFGVAFALMRSNALIGGQSCFRQLVHIKWAQGSCVGFSRYKQTS